MDFYLSHIRWNLVAEFKAVQWINTFIRDASFCILPFLRWWSRRACAHLLLQELQNCNLLLNNHQQENDVKWKSLSLTLCDPMDYRVHGILKARILEWVAFLFSRGSSQPRDQTQVSCISGGFFTSWATKGSPRILEWVAYPFSSISSQPRNQTEASWIAGRFFTNWAIQEALIMLDSTKKRYPTSKGKGETPTRW